MIPTRLTAVGSTEVEQSVQAELELPDPAPAVAADLISESTIDELPAGRD